ncbi:hypothetical protein V5799_031487 [Amblyomma americanum]|uniref:Uncharacterized protein n=1 Tax=Amblyomma americanum TaxID=6943 RepID=A0AAQ4EKP5_AMBAM
MLSLRYSSLRHSSIVTQTQTKATSSITAIEKASFIMKPSTEQFSGSCYGGAGAVYTGPSTWHGVTKKKTDSISCMEAFWCTEERT